MSNLETNEWLNFEGDYTDFDGDVESFEDMEDMDNFLGLSKRGRERRQLKKKLRSEGMSRKEARKMALQMVPRSKKKYLAQKAKQDQAPEEIQTLQEQGVISTDPDVASAQITTAINENIAEGTQATGSTGMKTAGVGGGGNKTMMYVGLLAVAGVIGYFAFFRGGGATAKAGA